VRASRSDLAAARSYDLDPLEAAERFVAAGARWLHVVDLERAFGVGDQTALVAAIVRRVPVPVQLGGALWEADDVAEMRDHGVQRILLGARAVVELGVMEALAEQFSPDSLGLALDVQSGRAWARHWDASGHEPLELARASRAAGISVVALTELSREGALGGADREGAARLAREAGVEVIVSGGVNGPGDLRAIARAGLAGAIVGRALHEGLMSLEEALECCR
jgi:phosphoribosylformimino-5-aminoimidazole carboxamide ribonucleotide (ProFAR) isomerase